MRVAIRYLNLEFEKCSVWGDNGLDNTSKNKGKETDSGSSKGVELYEILGKLESNRKRTAWKAWTASLLLFVSGIFGIFFASISIVPGLQILFSTGLPLIIVGSLHLFLGISSLVSGILAALKKWHRIAIAFSIPSIFILVAPGLIALVLLLFADDDFKS